MGALRKLSLRHWSWLHFKVSLLVWALAIYAFTPTKMAVALGAVVVLVTLVTVVGALVSMAGIVMSAQVGTKVGTVGISIELAGLVFMSGGPLVYLITQVGLAITLPDGEQRYALCVLAYSLCAALLCRVLIVLQRRNREAHDPTKDV